MERTKRRSFLMIFALILILPLAFFLTACGGSSSNPTDDTNEGQNEIADTTQTYTTVYASSNATIN